MAMLRLPSELSVWTVASSAVRATLMSEGLVAMQCSLVPRMARLRLSLDRGTPAARFAFVAWRCGIAEVDAARSLQQVAAGRRHVPQLCRCARKQRLGEHGVVRLDQRMIREIGIAHRRAYRDATIVECLRPCRAAAGGCR